MTEIPHQSCIRTKPKKLARARHSPLSLPLKSGILARHTSRNAQISHFHTCALKGVPTKSARKDSSEFSQVGGEFKLLRILCHKRWQILIVEAYFLTIPHVLIGHRLRGEPTNEMLSCFRHDEGSLSRNDSHPGRKPYTGCHRLRGVSFSGYTDPIMSAGISSQAIARADEDSWAASSPLLPQPCTAESPSAARA